MDRAPHRRIAKARHQPMGLTPEFNVERLRVTRQQLECGKARIKFGLILTVVIAALAALELAKYFL
jgi:hypothetical protein